MERASAKPSHPRLSHRWLYALLAGAGLTLALSGALAPAARSRRDLPPGVVARINTTEISQDALRAAVERLYPSESGDVIPERRAEALRFLIDEELLVQRALQLRLPQTDRAIRSAIVMGMIDSVVADVRGHDPSRAELREYYASHRAVFTEPPRWHVRHMRFDRGDVPAAAVLQASDAREAVAAGMPFAEARARFGAAGDALPDAPAPAHVLRRYLGPALTDLILRIPAGALADLIETSSGFHVIEVVAVQPETVRPFEDVADIVRREYIRRARDAALDELLTQLKASANIALAAHAPGLDEAR